MSAAPVARKPVEVTGIEAVESLSRLLVEASLEVGEAQERGNVRARSRGEALSERVIGLRQMLIVALGDAGVKL